MVPSILLARAFLYPSSLLPACEGSVKAASRNGSPCVIPSSNNNIEKGKEAALCSPACLIVWKALPASVLHTGHCNLKQSCVSKDICNRLLFIVGNDYCFKMSDVTPHFCLQNLLWPRLLENVPCLPCVAYSHGGLSSPQVHSRIF